MKVSWSDWVGRTVGDPNRKSKCWDKLDRVVKELNVSKSIDDQDGLRLITLE